jgi:hypothetical protein
VRVEYVVVSLVLALIIILLAVSLLTGAVPGVESVLKTFRGLV